MMKDTVFELGKQENMDMKKWRTMGKRWRYRILGPSEMLEWKFYKEWIRSDGLRMGCANVKWQGKVKIIDNKKA